MATGKALDGKPYAGNPHVCFDEGEVAPAAKPRRGSLLYNLNRNLVRTVFALVVTASVASSYAATETVGGITWNYIVSNGGSKIYKDEYTAAIPTSVSYINIPSTLGGYPVTSIGDWAFDNCRVRSVTIPDSVTSIGEGAFYGCSSLESITIPDSVTSIGEDAFFGCSSLTSVTISDSVTSIGKGAFLDCKRLKSVYITDIAKWCNISFGDTKANPLFYAHNLYLDGEKITSLVIPDVVTNIAEYAFRGCSGLTSVTIPDSVTSIGNYAFEDCIGLTSVTIGKGVAKIGWDAFGGCSSLANVHIADIAKWCDINFFEKESSPISYAHNLYLDGEKITSLIIPDGVTNIAEYAFNGCSGLTSVTIPNSVMRIGVGAFSGCSGLTSVTIGNGATSIGGGAFSGCSGLTSVTIPDSVASIGGGAFDGCNEVLYDSTTIPGVKLVDGWAVGYTGSLAGDLDLTGVRGIEYSAFSGCSGLTSVTIPESVTSIGDFTFYRCNGLTSVTIPDSVTNIGYCAFCDCSGLTSVTIPGSPTIVWCAFEDCSGLKRVYITDIAKWCDISFLGSYANPLSYANNLYLNDEKVADLVIPDSVTNIGPYAFEHCSSLTSVTISDSVTNIGSSAFYGCSRLTSVTIPDSVTSIGWRAFKDCNEVLYDTTTIPGVKLVDGWAIGSDSPNGSLDLTDVRGIGGGAFSGCSGLTSVTIPNSVTSIGASAFRDCSNLTSVTIPGSATSIGDFAFSGCSGLTSVTIPDSATSIGYCAFYHCSGLTSVTIPGAVITIDEAAFWYCDRLSSVTMEGDCPAFGFAPFYGVAPSCVVRLPQGNTTYSVTNGKWLGMTVEYYEPEPRNYSVTYNPGVHGSGSQQTATKTQGVALELKGAIFTRTGYTQTGWTMRDGGTKAYDLSASYAVNAAVSLYPFWTANTYAVTLDMQGGSGGTASATATYDATMPSVTVPVRSGYIFGGYYTSADESGIQYYTSSGESARTWDKTGATTLYARWMVAPAKTYTITYAPGSYGLGSRQTATKTQGVALELKGAIFTRSGYTQTGWTTSDDGTKAYDLFALYKNDAAVTLYPFWKAETVPGGGESGQDIDFPATKDWEYVSYNGEALIVGRDRSNEDIIWLSLPDPCKELETGYSLPNDDYASAIASDTAGAVAIPAVVGGLPVTTIGKYAFCTCSNVTAITIPASVKHVAAGAFNGCKSLEKISVASGNTAYKIENGLLLTADGKRIVAAPRQIEKVAIPADVEYIDDYAFFGCGRITKVEIPEGVVGIGLKAFFGCKSLVRVSLPSTFDDFYVIAQGWGYWEHEEIGWDEETGPEYKLTWEGDEWWEDHPLTGGEVYYPDAEGDFIPTDYNAAFGYCESLRSIEVAAGNKRYKSVGGILSRKEDSAIVCFPGGLKTAEIKSPVATIGHCAFYGNLSLESLVIGESVKYVDSEAFLGCASLTNVVFKRKNAGDRIYFCNHGHFAYGHFAWCTSLERISLPDGIMNHAVHGSGGKGSEDETFDDYSYPQIASSMFQHCHELKDVKLPDTLEGIGEYAFASCWKLEKIAIPANVTYLEQGAFLFCVRLRTVDFKGKPDDVDLEKYLWELLFMGDEYETYPDDLLWELEGVFGQTSWILSFTPFELEIEDGVLTGFRGCCPEELAIPKGVTEIGDSAFDYDENVSVLGLKKITFPSGLKRVGKWAFFWAGLENVALPEGVTELGEGAFLSCTNMVSLYLPQSLTALSPSAFRNCGSLREIVIPKGVTEFGERALAYCVGLESLRFRGNAPKCDKNAFLGINPDCTVHVLPGTAGWNKTIPGMWNGMRIEYDPSSYSIGFDFDESYTADADGTFALNLLDLVYSEATPKVSVKGLPQGLKYDANKGVISGKATKPGVYRVTVSATSATVKQPVVAEFEIVVPNLACKALPNLDPDVGAYGVSMCGVAFPSWLVDCTAGQGWTVKVSGLPAGLKYDAKTGKITGVPTKAGAFTVTFTASKKGEVPQTATITLKTEALPDWAQGTFAGYVRSDGEYSTAFGAATMTVAANGKISGKIALTGTNWTFSAASFTASDGDGWFEVAVDAKAGKATMPVEIVVSQANAPAARSTSGTGGSPVQNTSLVNASCEGWCGAPSMSYVCLWRNVWKDKATSAAAKAVLAEWEGVYTLSAEDGGYVSLTVGKNGDVKAAGKLSDGTSISATAPLMYDVCNDFFTVICLSPSAYKGGYVWLPVGFGTERGWLNDLGYALVWSSLNPQATGEYGMGFVNWTSFTGAYYDKTRKLNEFYKYVRLDPGAWPILAYNRKETYFDEYGKKKTSTFGDEAYAVDTSWQDGLTATVDGKGAFVVDKATKPVQDKETKEWLYDGANDGAMTLSFAQATGIFKGTYTFWYDYASAIDETADPVKTTRAHTSKKVSFEGIMVQGEEFLLGFYLWDAVGEYYDGKAGKDKTYKYKDSYGVTLMP